jgi:predicted ribosomally synthesized peptide with SipW-like signal peptide
MSKKLNITRRKALGALGTIGIASAGAGLGTTAFFSDREDFEGNKLVAGELDLKVDWQEHYSDWSDDEDDDTAPFDGNVYSVEDAYGTVVDTADDDDGDGEAIPIEMWSGPSGTTGGPNEVPTDYLGFPTNNNWLIAVPNAFADDILRNTAVEAYPDADDNGLQDRFTSGSDVGQPRFPDDVDICNYVENGGPAGADTPTALSSDLRTSGNGQESSDPDPLLLLEDIKPGDWGELTLSVHLCDNDGYLWLQAANVVADENGTNEAEASDLQEQDGLVELLDAIRVELWYDWDADGPNNSVTDGDNYEQDDEAVLLRNVSLRAFLTILQTFAPGQNVQGIPLDGNPYDTLSSTVSCVKDSGNYTVNFMSDTSQTTYTVGPNDEITISNINRNADGTVQDFFYQADPTTLGDSFLGVCTHTRGLDTDGDGTQDTMVEGGAQDRCDTSGFIGLAEDDPITSLEFDTCVRTSTNGERDCFTASNTYNFGIAWWLPVDHGNEVQSDSVSFDLGFYTEQCRHNDGSGQPAE